MTAVFTVHNWLVASHSPRKPNIALRVNHFSPEALRVHALLLDRLPVSSRRTFNRAILSCFVVFFAGSLLARRPTPRLETVCSIRLLRTLRSTYFASKEQVKGFKPRAVSLRATLAHGKRCCAVKPRAVSLRATLAPGKRCARIFAHSLPFLLICRQTLRQALSSSLTKIWKRARCGGRSVPLHTLGAHPARTPSGAHTRRLARRRPALGFMFWGRQSARSGPLTGADFRGPWQVF
jgi:hypothetical protein